MSPSKKSDKIPKQSELPAANMTGITFQSVIGYAPGQDPPDEEVPVVFSNPLLRTTLVNPTTWESRVDTAGTSTTVRLLNPSRKLYSVPIPGDSVFAYPVSSSAATWFRWLMRRDSSNPKIG